MVDYIEAKDEKYNRNMLERGGFKVLLSPEKESTKKPLKQEDSGFNSVLAKIAKKNKIAIGINLDEIKSLEKTKKAERIGKIMQNIKICRKIGTSLAVKGNKKEAPWVLVSLGSSTQQAKEAITQSF